MPYWNRQELLDRSLAAYRRHYDDIEICIADDGSDPSVKADGCVVSYLPKKTEVLCPVTPINAAVASASGDTIVLTNPEIYHPEPVLDELERELNEIGDMGYVTASCRDGDTWIAHSSVDATPTANRGPRPEGSQFHFCAMFRRSLWDRIGGMDEEYRAGACFDDNDLLWRLEDSGAIFRHRDDLVVEHTRTGGTWPADQWMINRKLFIAKWGHKWQPAPKTAQLKR